MANLVARASGEQRLETVLDVLGYLKAEGWKVAKSKLYADRGKIDKEKDGTFTKKAVDRYARFCLEKLDGSDGEEDLSNERLKLELLVEEKRKKKRENEIEEGRWVLKTEAEQKHTAKLALFLTAVDNFINGGRLDEAVAIVGGDKEKAAEFKAFVKKHFREFLFEYARQPVFAVPRQTMDEAEAFKADADAS